LGASIPSFIPIAARGNIGVDIFFVISGFVIAHTTLSRPRGASSARHFIKHRLLRIYLGYWPFFIAALAMHWAFFPENYARLKILESGLLLGTEVGHLVLDVSWSLTYELYFYAIFLLMFFVPARFVAWIIYLCFFLVFLNTLTLGLWEVGVDTFFTSPFLLEFFSGSILYLHKNRFHSYWWLPCFVSIIGIALWMGSDIGLFIGDDALRIFTYGTAALFIVILAIFIEQRDISKAKGIAILIGDASYTIYLSHAIILTVAIQLGYVDFLKNGYPQFVEAGFILLLGLIILFSVVFYRVFELRLYRWACSR
jgi:exopolysaccharide production protein ExoZ